METIVCPKCKEAVSEESEYCIHCGALLKKDKLILCALHPDTVATAVCVLCQQPLCSACTIEVENRTVCIFHQDVEILDDWAVIFQSTDITEAELIRAVLKENDFQVVVQNFDSIGYAWDGGGESPISRSNLNKPARILVPLWEYGDAEQCIEEWRSGVPRNEEQKE